MRQSIEITLNHFFTLLLHPFPTLFRDDFQAVESADTSDQASVERNLRGSMLQVAESSDWPLVAVGIHTVFNATENAEVGEGSDWQGEKFVVRHAQRIQREPTWRKIFSVFSAEKKTTHFLLSLDKNHRVWQRRNIRNSLILNELRGWGPPPRCKSLIFNELRELILYDVCVFCQAFFSDEGTKKSLLSERFRLTQKSPQQPSMPYSAWSSQ